MSNLEQEFKNKISASGLVPPQDIIMDGRLHRFASDGRKGKNAGWYIFYADDKPVGVFGCYRTGIKEIVKFFDGEITPQQRHKIATRKDVEEGEQAFRAHIAKKIWDKATPAMSHPYLEKKKINANGAKVTDKGVLVLPILDASGFKSLQFIAPDGSKKFLKGASKKGGFWFIDGGKDKVYICEGYSTACSIYEATGKTVFIAYSAENLKDVAKKARDMLGDKQKLVVVGDNDILPNGSKGIGHEVTPKAAGAVGATWVIPPIDGMDANDYANAGHDLKALLEGEPWLTWIDDFCKQPAPIKWLIKGWIQEKGLFMLYGAPGSGKSFIALDIAMTIGSSKEEWAGIKAAHGVVAYLAGEGHAGLRERATAWKNYHQKDGIKVALSRHAVDLNTKEGFEHAYQELLALPEPPKLIIVDTLARFQKGDENSAEHAKTMVKACDFLQSSFQCAVLIIHHTNKEGGLRGSSVWPGALETEILAAKGENKTTILKQMKNKDFEEQEDKHFLLQKQELYGWIDEDGNQVSSAVPVPVEAEEITKEKADVKLATFSSYIKRGWGFGGHKKEKDKPFILKEDLLKALEQEGIKESTIKQHMKKSAKGNCIGYLLEKNLIQEFGGGWVVIDDTLASQIMMFRV